MEEQRVVEEQRADGQPAADDHRAADEQRRTLWRTSWGVVLAASAAFSIGYGASRAAHPSVGASRPPAWPLFITVLVVVVSIWFVLAPKLHRWPFENRPAPPHDETLEPWLTELTDAEER